jgi:hypothetical protein
MGMSKLTRGLGYAGAVIMLLSAGMHEFAGWPSLQDELAKAATPAPLVQGLAMVWHFAGLAMAMLALLLILHLRGGQPRRAPFLVVGIGYALFGIAELVLTHDPFPLIFVLPGVLLVAAGLSLRRDTA